MLARMTEQPPIFTDPEPVDPERKAAAYAAAVETISRAFEAARRSAAAAAGDPASCR